MKYITLKNLGLIGGTIAGTVGLAIMPVAAIANTTSSSTSGSSTTAGSNAQLLQMIINRGNSEIDRRLTQLNTLDTKISNSSKINSSDASSMTAQVNGEISGLQSLKTTLDAETTLAGAKTAAESIFSEYRVYALITPKVNLVKTADDQQVTESKLSALAAKLQADITADQNAGKTVSSLQTELNDLTAKVQAAQSISSSIETAVAPLQPSDYNSDHAILSGDGTQLKTAQTDIVAAITDAKNIISSLKTL
jgi:hypothetical protein